MYWIPLLFKKILFVGGVWEFVLMEDSLGNSSLFFYCVYFEDGPYVFRLGDKHLCPMKHLTNPPLPPFPLKLGYLYC